MCRRPYLRAPFKRSPVYDRLWVQYLKCLRNNGAVLNYLQFSILTKIYEIAAVVVEFPVKYCVKNNISILFLKSFDIILLNVKVWELNLYRIRISMKSYK